MNAKERRSGVDVVYRGSPEEGDSILGVFSWEPSRAKTLTESHGLPGCARASIALRRTTFTHRERIG